MRKDLLDLFAEVDQIGKKIIHDGKNMSEGSLPRRLHESIYVSILNFLQMHMFTLQLLPSISRSKEHKLGTQIRLDDIQGQAILDSIRQLELDKDMIKKSIELGDKDAANVIDDQIKQLSKLTNHLDITMYASPGLPGVECKLLNNVMESPISSKYSNQTPVIPNRKGRIFGGKLDGGFSRPFD